MVQWLKGVSAGLCFLTILLHLVPNGKFEKYVRFYGGLLFLLVAAEPLLDFFTEEGALEQLIQLEFLKEEHYELETSLKGMEELKNNSIRQAYQQEIQRQLEEMVQAYGLEQVQAEAKFASEDGYTLDQVWINAKDADTATLNRLCQEIASIYSLEQTEIRILE